MSPGNGSGLQIQKGHCQWALPGRRDKIYSCMAYVHADAQGVMTFSNSQRFRRETAPSVQASKNCSLVRLRHSHTFRAAVPITMTIPLFQPHHYHPENVLLVTTTTSSSTGSKSSSIITTPSSLSSALTTNKKVAGVPFPPRHPQHPQLAEASFLVENYHIDDFATARDSCCSSPEYGSDDDSDEDASVETLSTACSDETNSATTNDSNSSNSSSNSRSVSFCSELVTDVWTRPFTNEEDLSELFYSSLETQRCVGLSVYVERSIVYVCM